LIAFSLLQDADGDGKVGVICRGQELGALELRNLGAALVPLFPPKIYLSAFILMLRSGIFAHFCLPTFLLSFRFIPFMKGIMVDGLDLLNNIERFLEY